MPIYEPQQRQPQISECQDVKLSIYDPQVYPRSSPAVKGEGQEFETPATNKNCDRLFGLGHL